MKKEFIQVSIVMVKLFGKLGWGGKRAGKRKTIGEFILLIGHTFYYNELRSIVSVR